MGDGIRNIYDDAWMRAEDAGLCRNAAADYAYDAWRGAAPPPVQPYPEEVQEMREEEGLDRLPPRRVSDEWLEDEYGGRCRP